ncbi:MAG TPA: reverse transcriptase-like protein [Candidatus Saccharimonadales bacterium]|nr:reverse transcriptase-like protein [Candidatus Saccharimonadales bacterium]
MKQRVVVQAFIEKDDKILLLKRSRGRPELIGKYELPGGRLGDGEQPDDALKRLVYSDTGLTLQSVKLHDVMSLENDDEGAIQHIFIVYLATASALDAKIVLGPSYSKYEWQTLASISKLPLRDSAELLLGLARQDSNSVRAVTAPETEAQPSAPTGSRVIIYSDGGSRGNPGPSSAGFVIMNENQEVIEQGGIYLGITTNNQAEYHGVQLGLEKALAIGARNIDFRVDSMLVLNQMKGLYSIKNRELWPIHERINELVGQFDKVTFTHVPRELNRLADGMVNKILNEHQADVV